MQVAVLGAGVTGVACAYYLAARGADVTLIERAAEPAAGASHANGGQLSYSFTDALARPAFLATLPRLLAGRDPGCRVRLPGKPPLAGWALAFLRQCTSARARANTLAVLDLAMRSSLLLKELIEATGIEFAHSGGGKLVLLPPGANLDAARQNAELKRRAGCETSVLSLAEAQSLEPALAGFPGDYAGAVYAPRDEVGDARAFTRSLAAWLAGQAGVDLRCGTAVSGLETQAGRLVAVSTDSGRLPVDAAVVCLGAGTRPFLRKQRLRAPIYPVRGYSLTLPRGTQGPSISVTDLGRRILFCPLDGRMRVSGFADFVGDDTSGDAGRIDELRRLAASVAPAAADWGSAADEAWAGDRPMTPDGRPLIGPTPVDGLWLNSGHGMLGWTLATATGHAVAEAVCAGRD